MSTELFATTNLFDTPYTTFGAIHAMMSKEMKVFRVEHGLTQAGLADLLGVTRVTISNWERGKTIAPANLRDRAKAAIRQRAGHAVADVDAANTFCSADNCPDAYHFVDKARGWARTLKHPRWFYSSPLRSVVNPDIPHTCTVADYQTFQADAPTVAAAIAMIRQHAPQGTTDAHVRQWLESIGETVPPELMPNHNEEQRWLANQLDEIANEAKTRL